jgi:hypothetical protein
VAAPQADADRRSAQRLARWRWPGDVAVPVATSEERIGLGAAEVCRGADDKAPPVTQPAARRAAATKSSLSPILSKQRPRTHVLTTAMHSRRRGD